MRSASVQPMKDTRQLAELESGSGTAVPDDPSKVFTHHHAGLGGSGGSSYIDAVIRVDADTNGDAVLNQRVYLIQNWRHDVVATSRFNGRIQWIDSVTNSMHNAPDRRAFRA